MLWPTIYQLTCLYYSLYYSLYYTHSEVIEMLWPTIYQTVDSEQAAKSWVRACCMRVRACSLALCVIERF